MKEQFKTMYMNTPQFGKTEKLLQKLAKEYHDRCEAYDNSICPEGGLAVTAKQQAAINRNARSVKQEILDRTGVEPKRLQRSIIEELLLIAAEEYHKKLVRIAEKAKRESDEAMNVGNEILSIIEDTKKAVESGRSASLERIGQLRRRSDRVEKVRKKNLVKLFDKESSAKIEADLLAVEIKRLKYKIEV
jgi:hypothetical protein